MSNFGYPQYGKSQSSGKAGQSFIDDFIHRQLSWILRPTHQESDFGIDGYVDIVTDDNVTGRTIAIQIKHGNSYYTKRSAGGIRFDGQAKHLNYYLNCPCPIVLIVLNDDCTEGRWTHFNANITSPSNNGWWIEIPENNILNASVKPMWEAIAGNATDYSEQMALSWKVNNALDESDFGVYLVDREDILQCAFSGIKDIIERLSRNTQSLLKNRGTLEILIDGFNEDPRGVYEIPEVRHWYAESIKAGIPWFYFLGKHANGMGLTVLLFSCCDVTLKYSKEGKDYVEIKDFQQVDKWLEQNFINLNAFTTKNSISMEINKEMSEQACTLLRNNILI